MADYERDQGPRVNKTTVVARPVSLDEAADNRENLNSDHFVLMDEPKTIVDPQGHVIKIKYAPQNDPLAETAREAQVGFSQPGRRR